MFTDQRPVARNPTVFGYFIFQQDGAPAHGARETVELLKEVMPGFIPPSLWPPNSLDLNPVDYAIWGIMQERVYNKGKIANVEELRQRIVDEWERLDQRIIDGAVTVFSVLRLFSVTCSRCETL